jgi:hypothetical protein
MNRLKIVMQHAGTIKWIRLYNERGDGVASEVVLENSTGLLDHNISNYSVDLDESKLQLGLPDVMKDGSLMGAVAERMKELIKHTCNAHNIHTNNIKSRISLVKKENQFELHVDGEPKFLLTPTIKAEVINGSSETSSEPKKDARQERVGVLSEQNKDNKSGGNPNEDLFGHS